LQKGAGKKKSCEYLDNFYILPQADNSTISSSLKTAINIQQQS